MARRSGSTESELLLSVRSMAVGIGGVRLLDSLDLDLHVGEVVALLGPSGSGKTTLLRTVAGLIDPLSGERILEGVSPDQHGWPSYRRQVCYVAQRPVLLEGTVGANLALPFGFDSAGGCELDDGEAVRLLSELGLPKGVIDTSARILSEGQMQRACLARALLVKPRVLLLDEPTSALDPEATAQVEQVLLRALRETSAAAFIVTHASAQVERLAARRVDLRPFIAKELGDG